MATPGISSFVEHLGQPAEHALLLARYERIAAETEDGGLRATVLGMLEGLRAHPELVKPLVEHVVGRIGAQGVPVLDDFTEGPARAAVRSAVSRFGDWSEQVEPLASVRRRITRALGILETGGDPAAVAQLRTALHALCLEVSDEGGVTARERASDDAPTPVDVSERDFRRYRSSLGWYQTRFAEDMHRAGEITTDQYVAFCAPFTARDRVYNTAAMRLWPDQSK